MTDIPDPSNVLKIKDNPNELVFYTNIAGVRATPEEIIIHFGLREDDPNSGIFVAKAVMSLAHAKRLVAALSRTISNYEVNFGEIVVDVEQRLTPKGREILGVTKKESSDKNV